MEMNSCTLLRSLRFILHLLMGWTALRPKVGASTLRRLSLQSQDPIYRPGKRIDDDCRVLYRYLDDLWVARPAGTNETSARTKAGCADVLRRITYHETVSGHQLVVGCCEVVEQDVRFLACARFGSAVGTNIWAYDVCTLSLQTLREGREPCLKFHQRKQPLLNAALDGDHWTHEASCRESCDSINDSWNQG